MEVKLSPELQAKLDSIAAQQGRDSASLSMKRWSDWLVTTSGLCAKWKKDWRRSSAGKCSSTMNALLEWKSSSPKNNAAGNASPLIHALALDSGSAYT